MDEPFSALDVHTRLRMEGKILRLSSVSKTTIVFVTHDLEEAISRSDFADFLQAYIARWAGRAGVPLGRQLSG